MLLSLVVEDVTLTTLTLFRKLNVRDVLVVRGNKGYGFAMRGVRGQSSIQYFNPPSVGCCGRGPESVHAFSTVL